MIGGPAARRRVESIGIAVAVFVIHLDDRKYGFARNEVRRRRDDFDRGADRGSGNEMDGQGIAPGIGKGRFDPPGRGVRGRELPGMIIERRCRHYGQICRREPFCRHIDPLRVVLPQALDVQRRVLVGVHYQHGVVKRNGVFSRDDPELRDVVGDKPHHTGVLAVFIVNREHFREARRIPAYRHAFTDEYVAFLRGGYARVKHAP